MNFLGVDLHCEEFTNTAILRNQSAAYPGRSVMLLVWLILSWYTMFFKEWWFFVQQAMYANNIAVSVDHI